jgi:GNAT superfamily N-acetyltransferase
VIGDPDAQPQPAAGAQLARARPDGARARRKSRNTQPNAPSKARRARHADGGWVGAAVADDDRPIGFSVASPRGAAIYELDGLFVEPRHMHHGVGRLLVEDACARAARDGAAGLEVIAGPAQGFYEKVGFTVIGVAETRFGPAVRMRRNVRK